MFKYMNELTKTYKTLYLLNSKYKQLRKEDLDSREIELKKLLTLNKLYKNELFYEQIKEQQNTLKEDKYILAVAYCYNLDTKTSFCYRGFSDEQLKEYYREFTKEIINICLYEPKVKYKK